MRVADEIIGTIIAAGNDDEGRPTIWVTIGRSEHVVPSSRPAAKIAAGRLYSRALLTFDDREVVAVTGVAGDSGAEPVTENMFRRVDELTLSVRAAACLEGHRAWLVGDVVQLTRETLLATKNFGQGTLREIEVVLATMGLSLGMKVQGWPEAVRRRAIGAPEGA